MENNLILNSTVYIERCDKETENYLGEESATFLEQPIHYLKENKNEFIYVESVEFEKLGVEGISLEVDDVFGTYGVLLGLKLQKKYESALKSFMKNELHGDEAKFSLLFNQNDGLWDINFELNFVENFHEALSIGEAYELIYQFLKKMVEMVVGGK